LSDTTASIDLLNGVGRQMKCVTADRVLDSIGEFADRIRADHLAIGKVQIHRLRRVFDAESERKGDVRFPRISVQHDRLEAPLAKGFACGVDKERITRNGLQVGDGSVDSDNHEEIDYPFGVRESCLPRVNGAYHIYDIDTQEALLKVNARKFWPRCSTLSRCLCSEDRQ
jgi:hypothetical protein